ncbi:MAG: Wzy polymerase domain-containing protein [Burkholderiales bacterium]
MAPLVVGSTVGLFIALPWLNPFAAGPSAAVQPLLFAWLCCGVLALFAAPHRYGALALAVASAAMGLAAWGTAAHWWGDLREGLPWLGAGLAVAICVGIGRQPRFWAAIAWALLIAALLSSVIGLLQYFGSAAGFFPWLNIAPVGEAFGNLRQRNQLASLLNIGLVALWWLLAMSADRASARLTSHGKRQRDGKAAPHTSSSPTQASVEPTTTSIASGNSVGDLGHGLAVPAALLLALGNAATASRTGFVQLLMIGALGWWWHWQRRRSGAASGPATRWLGGRSVLLPALIAYAAGALLLPTLAGLDPNQYGPFARLAHGAQPCASRMVLWSNVLELIALKPWLGWGLNELDYAHFIHLYDGPRFCDILDNAHNLPLQLAVELGLPVALAVCGLVVVLVLRARPWREIDAARQFAWGLLAVIGVHSLLEYPLWYGPFQMACGLALGVLWYAPRPLSVGAPSIQSKSAGAPILQAFSAITIVAMCGLAAYDYSRVRQIYLPPEQRTPALRANPIEALAQAATLHPNPIEFARLTITPLTPANAAEQHAMAEQMLHFSPEPRVIERLIDSARLLGREDEVRRYQTRFKAAFPTDEAAWAARTDQPAAAASDPAR